MKRTERLGIRVMPSDKQKWKDAARAESLSLSAWIERKLNAEVDGRK